MSRVQNSNIQDSFFNQIRKDRAFVTIYLVNGIKLTGKIRSFDKFTVILENKNQEQMIFKHAISTVSPQKAFSSYSDYKPQPGEEARE